eukprot:5020049-Amphidinium_carterae.1
MAKGLPFYMFLRRGKVVDEVQFLFALVWSCNLCCRGDFDVVLLRSFYLHLWDSGQATDLKITSGTLESHHGMCLECAFLCHSRTMVSPRTSANLTAKLWVDGHGSTFVECLDAC